MLQSRRGLRDDLGSHTGGNRLCCLHHAFRHDAENLLCSFLGQIDLHLTFAALELHATDQGRVALFVPAVTSKNRQFFQNHGCSPWLWVLSSADSISSGRSSSAAT